MRPDKTQLNEQVKLVSGHNCVPELSQKSFLATQALYAAEQEMKLGKGKNNIRFYQYVQSFSPKDNITPEQAHSIGMQFVKEFFPKHEVLVATHLDNGQYHNHFVINATSFVDGSKLHMNKFSLSKMRQLSDEICVAHGLKVLKPYDPHKPSINLGQREYRAQQRGSSWKFELLYEITALMKTCGSRKEFIHRLREKGYDVRWEEQQKTMTYTCPNGRKVRDNKLHDTRFLKEAMQREFRIREQYLEQIARLAETDSTGNQRDTVPADSLRYTQGPLGADAFAAAGADGISGKTVPGNEANANSAGNDGLHQLDNAGFGADDNQADFGGQSAAATGWEESRRVYFKAVIAAVREQTRDAQSNRYAEQEAEDLLNSSAVNVGGAVGAGLGAVISLAEMSESDDPEEIRKRIEAQLAGQNLGFIIGIIIALLKEEKEEKSEQQTWQHRHRQLEQFDEEEQDEEQTDEMQMT